MDIIPAIDIKGGRCVRLYQGDYSRETVFSDDPVAVALQWQAQGASRLHLVDLDGAASGTVHNMSVVESIVKKVSLPIQLGGGIRDRATTSRLLRTGINRVILGTVAAEKPDLVRDLCREFGDAIAVGIDARDGRVATHGWLKDSRLTALEMARTMAALGVGRFIYTDIKRDGTLAGPNFEGIASMVAAVNVPVIAAGGISMPEHLRELEELGVEGAIVGKALYTGNINLREALASAQQSQRK